MIECADEKIGRLLTLYELGILDEAQSLAFEDHILVCDFCFRELQASKTAIKVLRTRQPEILAALRRDGITFESESRLWARSLAAAAKKGGAFEAIREKIRLFSPKINPRWVLIPSSTAAVVLCLLLLIHPSEYHIPHQPGSESLANLLVLADSIIAPPQSSELRSAMSEAQELFDQGMKAYTQDHYAEASKYLQQAVEIDPDQMRWRFYLGISYYESGQTKPAISELDLAMTMAARKSLLVWREKARWCLIQAYLRNNDAGTAELLLHSLIREKSPYSANADSLLQKIMLLQERAKRK